MKSSSVGSAREEKLCSWSEEEALLQEVDLSSFRQMFLTAG